MGFGHKMSSFGWKISEFGYKISSFRWILSSFGYKCWGVGYPEVQLVVAPLDPPHGIRVLRFGFWVENLGFRVRNIKLQNLIFCTRDPKISKFQVSGNSKFRVESLGSWVPGGEFSSFGYIFKSGVSMWGTLRSNSSSRHLILRVSLVACCPSRMPRGPPPCSSRKCGLTNL